MVVLAALVLPSFANAQSAFTRNDKIISAGLGIGMYGVYGSMSMPPIFAMFEMGVADKISAGGLVAYSGSSDDFPGGTAKYSYIVISARGSYHFLENQKNLDAYAGAGLGYSIASSSVNYTDSRYNDVFGGLFARAWSAGASYFFFDVHVGGRYFFSPKWAAMAEVGYGVGFLRAGVSYKL